MVNALAPVSHVDSTIRLRWEVTKAEFDKPVDELIDPTVSYKVNIEGKQLEWCLVMFPKGEYCDEGEKRMTKIFLEARDVPSGKTYQTFWQFGIETRHGFWPVNLAKKSDLISKSATRHHSYRFRGSNSCSEAVFCATDDFEQHFVNDKLTLVTSLVVIVEKDDLVFDLVDNVRSMSVLENLSDFKIIAGDESFPCHRVLLAGRSEYFEALFRNEPQKKELSIEKSPELIKAMLEFMATGLIPEDISETAMDLIHVADMFGLNFLTSACETQLVKDLSPENALETLIVFDKLDHILKLENRHKVIHYIIKEVAQIVKDENWTSFIQTYPNLLTEIFLAKFSPKRHCCWRCCSFASA